MKNLFRNIHLYLSLTAGLIIMLSALTGAILVFEDEIDHALNKERFFVQAGTTKQPLNKLIETALATTPKAKLGMVKVYNDKNRTIEIGLIAPEKKPEGSRSEREKAPDTNTDKQSRNKGGEKGSEGGKMKKGPSKPSIFVYINPYTGKVIEVFNRRKSFFSQVEMLHRFLLTGNGGIGKTIVGISTFFFFFILITGIILWWPKNKKILKQRLKIKSDAGWKRLNHDLHLVTGFYSSLLLLIIVITGLVMSYNWINMGIFAITGSKMENAEPPVSIYQSGIKPVDINIVSSLAESQFTSSEFYMLRAPKDSLGIFTVSVLPFGAMETALDTYFIDQYSGKLIGSNKASEKNTGQRIRSYIKPIHTGAIYGLPTKILSFILCLLTLIFPVTGVIMWRNRVNGKKKPAGQTKIADLQTA